MKKSTKYYIIAACSFAFMLVLLSISYYFEKKAAYALTTKSVIPDMGYDKTYELLIYGLSGLFGYASSLFSDKSPKTLGFIMALCGALIIIPDFVTDYRLLAVASGTIYLSCGLFLIFNKH